MSLVRARERVVREGIEPSPSGLQPDARPSSCQTVSMHDKERAAGLEPAPQGLEDPDPTVGPCSRSHCWVGAAHGSRTRRLLRTKKASSLDDPSGTRFTARVRAGLRRVESNHLRHRLTGGRSYQVSYVAMIGGDLRGRHSGERTLRGAVHQRPARTLAVEVSACCARTSGEVRAMPSCQRSGAALAGLDPPGGFEPPSRGSEPRVLPSWTTPEHGEGAPLPTLADKCP